MVEYGERGGHTAMAKSVGLPTGIAAKLILQGELPLTGCQLPTHATVRAKVLAELRAAGIVFSESTSSID